MAVFRQTFTQDLRDPLHVHSCDSLLFTGDNLSTTISVTVLDGGAAAQLSGGALCHAIRTDGDTVAFPGTVSGNVVSATLPQSCFAVPGPLAILLRVVDGSVRTTVFKGYFTVERSSTDTIVDPGDVIPDISDLLSMLSRMEAALDGIQDSRSAAAASAQSSASSAQQAQASAESAETAAGRQPIIRNGVWHTWNAESGQYQSTGTQAQGPQGVQGQTGPSGTDGVTYTPAVSPAGVLSWTNDGNRTNPASVDLVSAVIAALPSAVGVSF